VSASVRARAGAAALGRIVLGYAVGVRHSPAPLRPGPLLACRVSDTRVLPTARHGTPPGLALRRAPGVRHASARFWPGSRGASPVSDTPRGVTTSSRVWSGSAKSRPGCLRAPGRGCTLGPCHARPASSSPARSTT
jgi:hypothetical protein